MSVENEPLRLLSHKPELRSDGSLVVTREGAKWKVPLHFVRLFQMTIEGASITRLATELRASGTAQPFERVISYLEYLYDRDLLADRRTLQLVESLKTDYAWRSSFAFAPYFKLNLLKLQPGSKSRLMIGGLVVVSVLILFLEILVSTTPGVFVFVSRTWLDDIGFTEDAVSLLLAFWFTFIVGRSVFAAAQMFFMRGASGKETGLSLQVDAVSFSLMGDGLSSIRCGGHDLFFAQFLFPLLASPLLIGFFGPVSYVPLFCVLLLICEFSPFSRSAWTEWLRAFYNFRDRQRGLKSASATESEVRVLHFYTSALWTVASIAFFVLWYEPKVISVLSRTDWSQTSEFVAAAIFGVTQLVVFASLVDDIFDTVSSSNSVWSSSKTRFRSFWRRREAKSAIGEKFDTEKPKPEDLEELPFLRMIPAEARKALIEMARVRTFVEGQVICRQGADDRSIFVLLSGRVAVAKSFERKSGPTRKKVVALLDPGSVFGEAAFFFGQKRTADVVAVEKCRVVVIPHDESMKTLESDQANELQLRIWFMQVLTSNALWQQLPSEAMDALVTAGERQVFRAGEKLITEGEKGEDCFFIVQGQASVSQNLRGIGRMKAGDVVGEIALLNPGLLRTATVSADSEILAVKIKAARFWALLGSHLVLASEIERISQARLEEDRKRVG